MAIITIKNKFQIVIPAKVRKEVSLNIGDILEASTENGKIVLSPRVLIDRSRFPNANDEYTPVQRKKLNALLAKSLAEFKAGKSYGPFNTANEAVRFLHGEVKKTKKAKKS